MTISPHGSGPEAAADLLPLWPDRPGTPLALLLATIVSEVVDERIDAGQPAVAVRLDADPGHAAWLGETELRGALVPLVRAACEASAAARFREVAITTVDTGATLEIEVADSGPGGLAGLPAATRVAAAACHRACDRCGGDVRLQDCPDGGVAVTLRIPHGRLRSRAA